MKQLGELLDEKVTVGIGGAGWLAHRATIGALGVCRGACQGRSYVNWLRQGGSVFAPVTRDVSINGTRQPGDEDTTRLTNWRLRTASSFTAYGLCPDSL